MLSHASASLEKYLTFNLDKGVYGLEILRVKEIIGLMKITPTEPVTVGGWATIWSAGRDM